MNVAGKRNYNGWILCPSKSFPGKFYYFNVLNGEAAWSLNELEQKSMGKSFIQRADKWHTYPEPDSPPEEDAWSPYKRSSAFDNQVPNVFGRAVFPKYPTNVENYSQNVTWMPMSSPPQMGHTPVQMVHMPAQMGHTPVQMGHTPVQIGHMPVQMGHMPVQMVHTPVQIGQMTPQMIPMQQMGIMTPQMRQIPAQISRTQLTSPMYNPYGYTNFWPQEPAYTQPKWIEKGNQNYQNMFHSSEGPKHWPAFQQTEKIMPGRNVFISKPLERNLEQHTQTQMEKQNNFNKQRSRCMSENDKVFEIPKIDVIKNQRLVSIAPRQGMTDPRLQNRSFSEQSVENRLFTVKSLENLNGKFGNDQGYFDIETPKNVATKQISKTPVNLPLNENFSPEEMPAKTTQKHPFAPSDISSTVFNDDLTFPVKRRRPFSYPTSKYDENIDTIIKSKSFAKLTFLDDENKEENNDNDQVQSKCDKENEKEEIEQDGRDNGELDKTDLRYTLLAKRKKSHNDSQEKKTEVKKIKTSYTNEYKPEPKKKRVTFNLEEEVEEADDQHLENNGMAHVDSYTIQALREMGSLPPDEIWYMIADTDVLIDDYDFVINYVSSDPTCTLLIPDAVRREIEMLSRGDHRGRQRVLGARNLARKLANPPSWILFQDPDVEEMMTDFPVTDSIINCCLLMYNEAHHAVLLTNNTELHEKAQSAEVLSYILNDIKASAEADKAEVSFEFRKIQKSNSDESKYGADKIVDPNLKETKRLLASFQILNENTENNNYVESNEKENRGPFNCYKLQKINSYEFNNNKMADYEKERFPVNCFRPRLFMDSNNESTKPINTETEITKVNLETNKQNIIQKNIITSTLDGHKFAPKTQRESEESSDLTLSSDVRREIQKFKNNITKSVQIQRNVTIKPAAFNYNNNKTLNDPEATILNDAGKQNETKTFEEETPSEIQKENDKSTASAVRKIKRINAYTVEAQIKFMFRVKNEMVAYRIATRLDEWLCTFTQIMEDALTEILQQNSEMGDFNPLPWTLPEAIEYVTEVFALEDNSPIITLGNKIRRNLPQTGQPNEITPDDFMKLLGCGILLIKYMNSILDMREVTYLKQAEGDLLELLQSIEAPVGTDDEAPTMLLGRNDADSNILDYQERRNYVKNPAEVLDYLRRHFPAWKDAEIPMSYYKDKSKVIRTCGRDVKSLTLNRTKSITLRNTKISDQTEKTDNQINIDCKDTLKEHSEDFSKENNKKHETEILSGPKLLKKLGMSSLGQSKSQEMKEIDIEKREASMKKMTDMLDNILNQGITKHYDLDSVIIKNDDNGNKNQETANTKVSEGKLNDIHRKNQFFNDYSVNFKSTQSQELEIGDTKKNIENFDASVVQNEKIEEAKTESFSLTSLDDNAKDSNCIEDRQYNVIRTNIIPYNYRFKKIDKNKNLEPKIQEPGVTSNTVENHKDEDNIDSKNVTKDIEVNDLDALDYSLMDEDSSHDNDNDNISFGNSTESSRPLVIVEDYDNDDQNDDICNSTSKYFESLSNNTKPFNTEVNDTKSFDGVKIFFVELSDCFTNTFNFVQKNMDDFKDQPAMSIDYERRLDVSHKVIKIQDRFSHLLDKLECISEKKMQSSVGEQRISGGVIEKCIDQARVIITQLLQLLSLAEGLYDVSMTSTAASLILPYHSDHSKVNSTD